MSLKFWNDFTIFDQSVCSNPNCLWYHCCIENKLKLKLKLKQIRPPNILFYERSSLHPSRSVIVFIWSSFTKQSQGTKYGDQNVHFFDVTPYIIFTQNPVFLSLYWHIWHPWNISFPTIYNFMGVKCMLCSIKIGVFFTILGYETLFRTSLWLMTNDGIEQQTNKVSVK